MSGEQASTRPFSDEGYGVVRKIVKQGGKILFFQQAFFPILEVIVVCREINKDAALSEIDLVLMKLVRAGMTQLDDLASLCGLSSTRVKVVMSDLAGRGYIKHGLLAELTDLGEIAIDSGFDVLETKRAFYYVVGLVGFYRSLFTKWKLLRLGKLNPGGAYLSSKPRPSPQKSYRRVTSFNYPP